MATDKSNKSPVQVESDTFAKDQEPASTGLQLGRRHQSMLDDWMEIEREDAVSANALGYMGRILAQATLPHQDPKLPQGTMYSRTTGRLTLNIVATTRKYGIPYGSIPRVLLAWICTEAVKTKNRQLDLGRSQAEFLKRLGLHTGGADITRFKKQAMSLFRAMISVEFDGDDESQDESLRLPISSQDKVFWHSDPNVQTLWDNSLLLTTEFFQEVTQQAVPMDLRVYHALSKSPLAMDIYTWLTYRMFVLRHSRRTEAKIPWVGLKAQFGGGYADTPAGMRSFRYYFQKRLNEVLVFYPEARGHVQPTIQHLVLTPAPLHIPSLMPTR